MNKLNAHAASFPKVATIEAETSIPVTESDRSPCLIVLVPPDSDSSSFTRRLCKIAIETNSNILLLGVCSDANQELALRRDLATVAALIRDARVYVETRVEVRTDWLAAVKQSYQKGDMIVCIADQSVGLRRRPLSQILESTFQAPIYILSDRNVRPFEPNALSQVISWSGFLGIIIGFFFLQVKIAQLPNDWFQMFLTILTLIPELGLILLWNSLFS
jgi:hypothetical protein